MLTCRASAVHTTLDAHNRAPTEQQPQPPCEGCVTHILHHHHIFTTHSHDHFIYLLTWLLLACVGAVPAWWRRLWVWRATTYCMWATTSTRTRPWPR